MYGYHSLIIPDVTGISAHLMKQLCSKEKKVIASVFICCDLTECQLWLMVIISAKALMSAGFLSSCEYFIY